MPIIGRIVGEMTSPLRCDDIDAVDSLPINVMLNGVKHLAEYYVAMQ